jgi:hypothetical protein
VQKYDVSAVHASPSEYRHWRKKERELKRRRRRRSKRSKRQFCMSNDTD